jgi:hypothetical protein
MSEFTKYDLDNIIIKILIDNPNKLYSQNELFEKAKTYYMNDNEIFFGHFLLIWQKLQENPNLVYTINDMIKYKKSNNNEIIEHINKYPRLYQGYELTHNKNNFKKKYIKPLENSCSCYYFLFLAVVPIFFFYF